MFVGFVSVTKSCFTFRPRFSIYILYTKQTNIGALCGAIIEFEPYLLTKILFIMSNNSEKVPTPKNGWISFIIALISAIGGVLLEHFTNLIH